MNVNALLALIIGASFMILGFFLIEPKTKPTPTENQFKPLAQDIAILESIDMTALAMETAIQVAGVVRLQNPGKTEAEIDQLTREKLQAMLPHMKLVWPTKENVDRWRQITKRRSEAVLQELNIGSR